ncbi:autoinducer binding domain-containing protein [Spartinivicinus poritis]|uniref:Autoinducer binding domain-containing protein n=1 Tax=Spartinivicinus poritis TaxID=2994640 RepID=A0ABT5UFR7_9GAMM|nr:autoinducer binding domain-containing protein [Spartinivicinus sp. A2-2]MDE1464308.1 autoinducer binding domain-containing protein [Spartinivicinus sp. A2-2]
MSEVHPLSWFDEVSAISEYSDIEKWLFKELEQYGFPLLLFGNLTNPGAGVITNFPDEWMQRFEKKDYIYKDAPAQHCFKSITPIVWKDAYERPHATGIARKIINEAESFGLKNGLSIPVVANNNRSVLSVCYDGKDKDFRHLLSKSILTLVGLTQTVQWKLLDSFAVEFFDLPKLSKRQKDCLHYLSHGYTNKEIANFMKLSHYTVTDIVCELLKTLNASNRTEAVMLAIKQGII